MKAIDLITYDDLKKCIIKRKNAHEEHYQMSVKDYDVKITPTTQGSYQYPCIKLTFGNLKTLEHNSFVTLYLTDDSLFFIFSPNNTLHSRKLTFEKSDKRSNGSIVYGSYGVKITCSEREYKILSGFEGKYKIHPHLMGEKVFYVCIDEKL